MEYRKLISFGKSSYVVSLPKSWINQNKLKKGDVIYVEENGLNLQLSKKEHEKKNGVQEKVILIDRKPASWIRREVCSAYVQNYQVIILKGSQLKNQVRELQNIIQSFIALEIMEQTSEAMIARDFLNMDTVSVEELIKKMDIVIRTMIRETCNLYTEDNYKSLNERDLDINRLYFLIYRAILYNLENPSRALKNFRLTSVDLLKWKFTAFYLEAIADEVRRVARYMRQLKVAPAKQAQVKRLLEEVNQIYLETLKSLYAKNASLALHLADKKESLNRELEVLSADELKIPYLGKFVGRLQRMNALLHNLGRVVYTIPASDGAVSAGAIFKGNI